ncbi:MAG: PP2C family protein-serine/threonine phosphatase [Elainellaceae cyanobacterium]
MECLFRGLSDPGLVRSDNQDTYYIDPQQRFCIVADGMGGHAGGQEASRIATAVIQSYLEAHWGAERSSQELLHLSIRSANQAILEDQASHPERSDMGTTALVVLFRAGEAWCAHIGDCRLYRLRDHKLKQVTEDHTWVARALKMGDISVEEARAHPWRHILSQCLGREDLQDADVLLFDWQKGDRLLLCSDGLTEELPDSLIAKHLSAGPEDKILTALVDAAKRNGGRDNITVVTVDYLHHPVGDRNP